MEFESYADVIDSFERDDMGYASLTDYINGENIKIKEIEMDVMGDLKKALSSKKDGGLMVAIERFNQGGMAGNKTYHQYHDQYVPMDEESMMYANGGGVGSMMQPKKERVSFRGGGSYQGGSGVAGSAESKGMGGSGSSYSGGGGYSSSSNPTGNVNYGSAAREFVQKLNNDNAIRANQAGTKFTPYGGGSRPQGGIFSNMSFNPLAIMAGIFGGPLAGLLTRGIMMGKDKVGDLFGNFNKTMRGTNPDGTTRTQAEYEQDRYDRQQVNRLDKLFAAKDRGYNKIGFGDFTKKTMDFTEGQQAKIDGLLAQGYEPSTARNVLTGRDLNLRGNLNEMPAVNIQGLNNNDYEGEIGAVNNNDFVGLNTNATDMQNYMTDQASFTQPGITPTNLNDFEGIRNIPQLNNNDYQLGTPQLNNNDFIGLNQPGITPTNLNDFIGVNQPQEFVSNNPIGGVDQFAKEMEALEANLPMGVNRIMTPNQMGGTLQDFYTNKNLTGASTGGVPSNANSMFEVFNDNINFNDQASLPGNNIFAGLTEKQKMLLDQRSGMYPDILGAQEMLNNISSEDNPDDPATIKDVTTYLG